MEAVIIRESEINLFEEFVVDDKVKHRIVGVIVIAAFLVIIVPALIKNISVHEDKSAQQELLPYKGEMETFQTSQIAQVSLDHPNVPADTTLSASTNAIAQPVVTTTTATPVSAPVESLAPTAKPAPQSTPKPTAKPVPKPVYKPAPKTVVIKTIRPVPVAHRPTAVVVTTPARTARIAPSATTVCFQLGTFSNPINAHTLVNRLHENGYASAKATPITLPNGSKVERVSICRAMSRPEALLVKARLARLINSNVILVTQAG